MLKMQKGGGVYALVVGITMIVWWSSALLGGQMPEMETAPLTALMHVSAELLTGVLLIVGAYGLLRKRRWGQTVHLVSLGMLLYAVVQASGYYAQQGNVALVGLFATFAILSLFFVGVTLRQQSPRSKRGVSAETIHSLHAEHG
jgi:hypothetical protein